MKNICIFLLGLLPLVLSAGGDEKVLLNATFDTQTPGQIPKGWEYHRQGLMENFRYISNVEYVSKPNSLLLDFEHFQPASRGSNAEGHGYFVTRLPSLTDGQGELTFCVYVVTGSLTMELLAGTTGALYYIDLGEFLKVYEPKGWTGVRLGPLRKYVWYRVSLLMPTKNGRQHDTEVRLERRNPDGIFRPEQERSFHSPKLIVKGSYEYLRFNGVGKAKLYFDDIRLRKTDFPRGSVPK